MKLTATNSFTGEIVATSYNSPEEAGLELLALNKQIEALESLKKQLQDYIAQNANESGLLNISDQYIVRVTQTQRMQYDKAVLREVFDEDELDLFLEPAKGKIDRYIKDHLDDLGEFSTMLRESMIPTGSPYRTVKVERVA